jgi:HD-GYP domain-containing protein (c-di-GMP phosphodiesterase class II)
MSSKVSEVDSHVSIKIDKLQVGTQLPFDVYVKDGGIMKPLFNKGMIFSRIAQSVIQEKGISEIFVISDSAASVENYGAKTPRGEESILENPIAFKNYSHQKEKYFQIERALLISGLSVPFSLYAMEMLNFRPVAAATEVLPVKIDSTILQSGGDLCILSSDVPKYYEYLQTLSEGETLSKENISRVKALVVKENAKVLMKELLADPRSGQAIKQTGEVVNKMIDSILENRDTIYDLVSLKQYDYYTYTHSVNVGVLSVGLGVAVGIDRTQIALLGMGAMLHDVGKSAIPGEILNKQGKLDDTEFRIIKTHVTEGEKILRANPEVPEAALPAALQHHEKMTGRGYPHGLKGPAIKLFGRIAAIADCYDALTTRRPYKAPMAPFYALSIIAKDAGDYDPELLKIFIKMLGKIK